MAEANKAKYVDIPAQTAQRGDDAWRQGNYDESRSKYIEAARLYDDNEDYQGEAQVLSRLGELELSLENYEDAEKSLTAAVELVRNIPNAESTMGEAFIKMAKVYTAQYEFEQALQAAAKARKVFTDSGSRNLLGDCYDQEAYIYLMTGNDDKALAAYTLAADLFEHEGMGLKEASVLRAMARIEMKKQNYDHAHDLLEKCRALYRENGDILGEASALSAIGCLRYIIRDIGNARKALMKSVYLYGKVLHHFAEAEALLYLARVEAFDREQGDFARAKVHYKKSIELFDFLQNETMKNAVLDEYEAFKVREAVE